MNNIPFSILIANYNNGCFIQEAINSILNQTYQNWEVIIVDDASTDNSNQIYDELVKDKRFKIYYNNINNGCGYTKRKCAELASGELCGFLDPDDALAPNALEIMINLHKLNNNCSLIYSTLYMCNGLEPINGKWGDIGVLKDLLISEDKIISQFATFKRKYYLDTDGIDEALKSSVDRDLYFKLEEVGDILFYDEALYYYRINNENSLSIGSEDKINTAYKYRVKASLNACCRRISTNNKLFVSSRTEYLQKMRIWLGDYKSQNKKTQKSKLIKYVFFYLKGNNFTIRSFLDICKLSKRYRSILKIIK